MSALLDTSILIDHLRGLPAARDYLVGLESTPACSEITRIEVWRGLRSGERAATERLFGKLRWQAVDESVARRAGELGREWRRSHARISVADLAIAATAEDLELPLATVNVRHFPMFRGLRPAYR